MVILTKLTENRKRTWIHLVKMATKACKSQNKQHTCCPTLSPSPTKKKKGTPTMHKHPLLRKKKKYPLFGTRNPMRCIVIFINLFQNGCFWPLWWFSAPLTFMQLINMKWSAAPNVVKCQIHFLQILGIIHHKWISINKMIKNFLGLWFNQIPNPQKHSFDSC